MTPLPPQTGKRRRGGRGGRGEKKHRKNDGLPVVVFKVEFSDQLRELKLLPAIAKLIGDLRKEVGDDFLEGARTIVAHPVQQNTFVRTYIHCFLPRR